MMMPLPMEKFEALAWKLELRRSGGIEALFIARTGKTLYDDSAMRELVQALRALATTLELEAGK